MLKKIATLHAKNSFAFAIIAGNFFGETTGGTSNSDLDALLQGRIEIPLPTYFALGKSPLPPSVVEKLESNNGELCENLFFLGKRTTLKTAEGVRIVALGGILDANISAEAPKDRYAPFHSLGEAKALKGANAADILITTEWPQGITKGSQAGAAVSPSTAQQESIADLCAVLKPRYHFSTNSTSFFEREPFFHQQPEDKSEPGYHITRFIALAPFGNNAKQKWIYAFTLDPTAAPPVVLPPGTTASPLATSTKKRAAPASSQDEGFSRYATGASAYGSNSRPSKRSRQRQPPPGPDSCFFCLSNPNTETHLVTSIGDDAYMTTAKGPLSTSSTFSAHGLDAPGHMLIIPLPHVATLASIAEDASRTDTIREMRRLRSAVHGMLASTASGKLGAVTWEVSRAQGIHTHWQLLPVPADLVTRGLVEAAFKVEAENDGYPAFEKQTVSAAADAEEELEHSDFFRVWIWSPDAADGGETKDAKSAEELTMLSLPLSSDFRFDLQFGRRVMAKLLGLEKRMQWRDCAQSEEEETADAEAWKALFKKWDFTLE